MSVYKTLFPPLFHLILMLNELDSNLVILDLPYLSWDTNEETESKRGLWSGPCENFTGKEFRWMIDFSIWVIIVFQKRNGFVSYYCNGDDTKQDKVSIENQKINHITQWFSKISGNVVTSWLILSRPQCSVLPDYIIFKIRIIAGLGCIHKLI